MSSDQESHPQSEDIEEFRASEPTPAEENGERRPGRGSRILGLVLLLFVVIAAVAFVAGRIYFSRALRANLPQLDGTQVVYGLSAPVTVERDEHGVPHIRAKTMEDLVFAQGYVTAQDRLWQMELLRRHAAGELAAITGRAAVQHDAIQRTLQVRAAADKITAALPADQRRWLAIYARGVNASMAEQRAHLPIEFRMLGYRPAAWTPRDSILVELGMYEEQTNSFSAKLVREALAAHLPAELIADLYPVGSWRDHPPGAPLPDVTSPRPEYKDVPLDETQSKVTQPAVGGSFGLEALERTAMLFASGECAECVAGSNGWAVTGTRTESGKPMLANDMHLDLQAPEVWYEADLEAPMPAPLAAFHAAGVTLPGVPFIIAGHNDHVAWGFTNLGADVQDLYIEHTRGTPTGAQYETDAGEWLPLKYSVETIHVRGGKDVTINVPLTHHGDTDMPVISSLSNETRSISLRWAMYELAGLPAVPLALNTATDWSSMLAAISNWDGPPLNLMYADDQGHIGYHAVGRVPVRGDMNNPSPLAALPTDAAAADAATHEWAGYIPFDQLPQAFDPPDGVLATANSRVTQDGYRYPITLDWMAPYRTERIYRVLENSGVRQAGAPGTTSGGAGHLLNQRDMLALQTDVYSELDHLVAQRLAYAIDHAKDSLRNDAMLRQAADLLRGWDGKVEANAAAPAIVNAERGVFWEMLLIPKLVPQVAQQLAEGQDMRKISLPHDEAVAGNLAAQYVWGERACVEEMLLTDTPARWLPAGYANWNDFLATVVQRGLKEAKAPHDLRTWQQGKAQPVDIEHPLFANFALARDLIDVRTGTGPQPQSGDGTTVKQAESHFGPSERFSADLSDPDRTTLDLALGEAGNPASRWYMDQFADWLAGRTYAFPFTPAATQPTITHTLTLTPR